MYGVGDARASTPKVSIGKKNLENKLFATLFQPQGFIWLSGTVEETKLSFYFFALDGI